MQQVTTRHVVLRIHQVEVALIRIDDDAVRLNHGIRLRCCGQAVVRHLMSRHINNAQCPLVLHCVIVELHTDEIQRVAYDTYI